jgi:hypothetical protein
MIDPKTGTIRFAPELAISPTLTRENFLSSLLGTRATVLVQNEPHCSFALPKMIFSGHAFVGSLWFTGSRLLRVSIASVDESFGSSWSNWSQGREMERKTFHDSLLQSALGPGWSGRPFPWGVVASLYDPKSGSSSIIVTY